MSLLNHLHDIDDSVSRLTTEPCSQLSSIPFSQQPFRQEVKTDVTLEHRQCLPVMKKGQLYVYACHKCEKKAHMSGMVLFIFRTMGGVGYGCFVWL